MAVDIDDTPASSPASFSVVTPSPVDQILRPPRSAPIDFGFSSFLAREYSFGQDPNRPICKAFQQGHCPNGSNCPDKHHTQPSYNNLVCKHWLRGLCKKGSTCEFLHEYNLRRMPECIYFARHQNCSNGDECLFLHVDPDAKRPPCPHYDRGFCPLGPRCALRHLPHNPPALCPFYLVGFCPEGPACERGAHARFPRDEEMKRPEVRVEKSKEEVERERMEKEVEMQRLEEEDRANAEKMGNMGGPPGGGRGRGWPGRRRRGNRAKGGRF